MINNSPLSQHEAEDSFRFLVDTTERILKISRDEATRRVEFLFSCGVLNEINPMEPHGQKMVDKFLAIPSRLHKQILNDYKSFVASINN